MISIRIADVRDAAAIAHVHVQSWLATYEGIVPQEYLASLNVAERIPYWQDWLQRDISVDVAKVEGEVVGFAARGARFPMRKQTEIGGVSLSDLALGWPDLKATCAWEPSEEFPSVPESLAERSGFDDRQPQNAVEDLFSMTSTVDGAI